MLETVKRIVLDAAKIMTEGDYAVHEKGFANFVTDKDVAVESFIRARIAKDIPDAGFVGEEEEVAAGALSKRYTAVVDPIDGTTNFIRSYRLSVISIALLEYGKPYIGVVYNPYSGELFCAERGKGATLNGVPIHTSDRPLRESIFLTAWCTYYKQYAEPCFAISKAVYPHIADIRRFGVCAYELCTLAAGRSELYFEILLFPWDFAAAQLILTEAGGFIETLDGAPVYNRPQPLLAANTKENFDYLKGVVKAHLPAVPYDL